MLDRDITNNLIAVSLTESKMTGYIKNKLVFFFTELAVIELVNTRKRLTTLIRLK